MSYFPFNPEIMKDVHRAISRYGEQAKSGEVSGFINCTVCEYRQTFIDGHEYPVNYGYYFGASYFMGDCIVPICREHWNWYDGLEEYVVPILEIC